MEAERGIGAALGIGAEQSMCCSSLSLALPASLSSPPHPSSISGMAEGKS